MDLGQQATIVLFTLIAFAEISMSGGTVYNVGGEVGWTSESSVDYVDWASKIKFHIGDFLHFEYNPEFHNVVEVSRADYHLCNTANPRATYFSGNDYIKIRGHGHYYFICGFPGHCALGNQKIHVRVPKKRN